ASGKRTEVHRRQIGKNLMGPLLVGSILWAVLIATLAATPVSHIIASRARSFVSDGFTGSGRTLLWRDSIKMVPAFAFACCGPEVSRKSFLALKSKETPRLSPQASDESSHDAYMDTAISLGLPGLILYSAIIASTLWLLMKVWRSGTERRSRIMAGAVASAF